MYQVLTLNQISPIGLQQLPEEQYLVSSELAEPDALLLRSHKLQAADIKESTLAIARAGAGVNNIPVEHCTNIGVPVFNTPGANANAVKELVAAALLLGSRGIVEGVSYVSGLSDMTDAAEMSKTLEKQKKQFKGNELLGKTLGIVGLGAIGSLVADMALGFGMNVVGYDPALSVEAAWRLDNRVQKMENLASVFARADYVSLHLPVLDSTRNLINSDLFGLAKDSMCLLNFAREEIIDPKALVAALDKGQIRKYISDFPRPELIGRSNVVLMPHIGASTGEAEDNCAIMAAQQLKSFLETGNVVNSVNFPALQLERLEGVRLAIVNKNVPKMLGNILSLLADENINVIDMINKSRNEIAYNLIDVASEPSADAVAKIKNVEGIVSVRLIS